MLPKIRSPSVTTLDKHAVGLDYQTAPSLNNKFESIKAPG